jgi:hypothetical protein
MGAGGALVPGGNDTLILVLIPTLSRQAVASYASLAGRHCIRLADHALDSQCKNLTLIGDYACTGR